MRSKPSPAGTLSAHAGWQAGVSHGRDPALLPAAHTLQTPVRFNSATWTSESLKPPLLNPGPRGTHSEVTREPLGPAPDKAAPSPPDAVTQSANRPGLRMRLGGDRGRRGLWGAGQATVHDPKGQRRWQPTTPLGTFCAGPVVWFRVLHLLGRCSTAWATPPVPLPHLFFLRAGVLPRLALNSWPQGILLPEPPIGSWLQV
jgi:hypothetical protein